MNWLAHLQLAEPEPRAWLGCVLPDLIDYTTLQSIPQSYKAAAQEHQWIDGFTDRHPVFLRSKQRLRPELRRFAGIVIDVLYDHFLATHWPQNAGLSAVDLVAGFYQAIDTHSAELPASAQQRLTEIRAGRWLEHYQELRGVEDSLSRIGRRMKQPRDLTVALEDLKSSYGEMAADFMEFYPALSLSVRERRGKAESE
jgi:acyl carrier protein phosphodiesterase